MGCEEIIFLSTGGQEGLREETLLSGPQIANKSLIKALRDNAHLVTILCPKNDLWDLLVVARKKVGRVVHFGHSGKWPLAAMFLLRLIGVRSSLTIHGDAYREYLEHRSWKKLKSVVFWWLMLMVSHRLFVVSPSFKDWLPRIASKKAEYLPNGFSLEEFCGDRSSTVASEERTVLLFTGGDRAEKGLPFLLQSLNQLSLEVQARLTLKVFGEIQCTSVLNQLSAEALNVELCGIVERALFLKELKKADALIQPSSFETFGMAALEAVFLGIPLIVTKECGVSTILCEHVDLDLHRIKIIGFGNHQALSLAISTLGRATNEELKLPSDFVRAFDWNTIATDFWAKLFAEDM